MRLKIEEVDAREVVINADENTEVTVEGIPEEDDTEGFTKQEEVAILNDIANAPGELKETPKKKRSKR